MKTAYLIDGLNVCEVQYERETEQTALGVSRVRDVLGTTYHVSARVEKRRLIGDLRFALDTVEQRAKEKIVQVEMVLAKIAKARKA